MSEDFDDSAASYRERGGSMASGADQERRRRQRNVQEASPLFVLPPHQSAPSEGRAGRRSRMSVSERFLERHRTIPPGSSSSGFANLEHAGRQLEQASSNLRALLDDPVPNISFPNTDPEYQNGEAESSRRAKRRKLDQDEPDPGFKGFSYGKYGQVEPGKLKMEIVSCDGGIFQDQGASQGTYGAENVLRNDASVYCTKPNFGDGVKDTEVGFGSEIRLQGSAADRALFRLTHGIESNRCNLVIRHQGSTPFCLKELIIRAPHSGYTAPVQEGMVFISMTSNDLLTRTAQYQIQYSPPRPKAARSNELPPIVSVRHNEDGTMTTAQARARRLYAIGLEDEDCDYRTAQIPSEFTENAPPFQVTTECSDSEDDEAMFESSRHRNLHRSRGLRFEGPESSSEEEIPEHTSPWHEDYLFGMGRAPRLRRRETASNITLAEAAEASQIATQEAVRAVGGELMAPHARFFIERDKSKCTVKFDPPVSGRFILLKMWSPHHSANSNIDIQSVVARGFAGPRLFPAITLR